MSFALRKNCLYCSLILAFMLFYQSAKAQDRFEDVNKWLAEETSAMGGRSTLMIFKDGKIIYSKSMNDMNARQKFVGKFIAKRTGRDVDDMLADFSPEHKIAIASCSKWLSAALVMTFVDEGKLSLKDTVGKFLPVLRDAGKGNITIADCLSHMTGIRSGSLKESRAGFEKAATMDEAMRSIADLPMESAPGQSFHYSSVGLQIAAAVIEKISGKDFRTLFEERIAKPCGMTNTDFGPAVLPIPAGSAQSTPSDYLHFLQMILNKGNYNGVQVLKPETVAAMQKNYVGEKKVMYTPAEAGNWGYGLGEWVPETNDPAAWTSSVTSPGLFGSFPWVNNDKGYAAVLFTFYIKNKGRHQRYTELKKLVDKAVSL